MTIEVVPSDLRRAAQAMESAAQQVEGADPSGRVNEIPSALPGSASSELAVELQEKLEKRFRYWHRDAMRLRDGMINAVAEYERSDERSSAQAQRYHREIDEIHGVR